ELVATQGAASASLEQATLLALALRERRRVLGNWEQLAQDLSVAPRAFWKLTLSVLFGLLPQPRELLAALLAPAQEADVHTLGLHALVSNPLTLDEQNELLMHIVDEAPLTQFLAVLRQLAHMHLPLAQLAAGHALHKLETDTGEASELNQIERLLLQAEIRQLSGQHEEATPLLQSAWNAAQRIQTELAGKLAENAAVNSDAHLAGFEPAAAAKSGGSRHPAALIAAARVS